MRNYENAVEQTTQIAGHEALSMSGRQLSDGALQLDALDGLRGLAVLLVILAHTGNAGFHLLPPVDFSGAGHAGVFLFFGLSAFLLTNGLLAHGSTAFSKTPLLRYFERRFLRIYPLYFLYVTAAALSTWVFASFGDGKPIGVPMALTASEYVRQVLMIEGKGITWSIPVEVHYYFLLPFVAYVFYYPCKGRVLPALGLTALVLLAISTLRPLEDATSVRSVIYHLPVFLLGSVSAVLHRQWIENDQVPTELTKAVLGWIGIAALLAALLMTPSLLKLLGVGTTFKPHRQFLLFAFLWTIVLFASVHGKGLLPGMFRMRWLRYLGFISFGAYLFHPVFISVISKTPLNEMLNPMLSGWLVLIATVITAYASFRLIEMPVSKFSFLRTKT